jgi:hypothetical protein
MPLESYRNDLRPVKTVEQDLPITLNPLPAIYQAYWVTETISFLTFEEFFDRWWKGHLDPLDDFIKQYFWGCSIEFVRMGFKARLYRTLVSVLTQFHFAYSWWTVCTSEIQASADLDMNGLDALITINGKAVGLQVKKETYRREARGAGRFARRVSELIIEVPYTITKPEDWLSSFSRARTDETRERYSRYLHLSQTLQRWLPNGFVIFTPEYPQAVEQFIQHRIASGNTESIAWEDLLRGIIARPSNNNKQK